MFDDERADGKLVGKTLRGELAGMEVDANPDHGAKRAK